jgi:hypothetical protein
MLQRSAPNCSTAPDAAAQSAYVRIAYAQELGLAKVAVVIGIQIVPPVEQIVVGVGRFNGGRRFLCTDVRHVIQSMCVARRLTTVGCNVGWLLQSFQWSSTERYAQTRPDTQPRAPTVAKKIGENLPWLRPHRRCP